MAVGDRTTLSERSRFIVGSVLSVVIWLFIAVPRTMQSIAVPKAHRAVGAQSPAMIHSAAQLQLVLLFALGAVCFVAVVLSLPGVRLVKGGALIAVLAPWVYLAARDLELGYGVGLGGLLYPLVVVTIYFLRPPLACLKAVAHLTALTAIIAIAMAVLEPSSAIYATQTGAEITRDKQILPWGLLEGFLTQPNSLGLMLLLGLPMVLLLRTGRVRLLYVGVIGFALIWTASRSSIYTACICLVVTVLCSLARRSSATAVRAIGALAVLAMAAVLVMLPLVTTDPTAFTNRGYIWQVSLDAWADSPWFGLGADWYHIIATTSTSLGGSVTHGHNQFVQALVTGGGVLVALMAVMLATLTLAALRWAFRGELFGIVYLIALLGSCWLEVSMVFVRTSSFVWVFALPIAVLVFAPDRDRTPGERQAVPPARSALGRV